MSSLKPVMVSFRIPNFHDLIEGKKISAIEFLNARIRLILSCIQTFK